MSYRGSRVYDDAIPAPKALVHKYADWNNKYMVKMKIHTDIIHLRQPNGQGIDAPHVLCWILLHVCVCVRERERERPGIIDG